MKYANACSVVAAVALTAGGIVALTGPAWGKSARIFITAPSPDTVSRQITYADLNLASTAGETSLIHRVRYGVSDLCNEVAGGYDGSAKYKVDVMSCSSAAWNQANPQISRAVQRAREIASTGSSTIAAAALTISIPH